MPKFFVFRHGETLWNRARRMQGQTDTSLSDVGEQQAHDLAQLLAPLNLQIVVTSDLQRARRTAEIATRDLGLELRIAPELREAHFGQFEGLTADEISERHGETFWLNWLSVAPEHLDICAPGGETKREILTRARGFLRSFHLENPHFERIGICSHGGLIARLLHAAMESPTDRLRIGNCKLYEIDYESTADRWIYRGERG